MSSNIKNQYTVANLLNLTKTELLILCEKNPQVFKLCNENSILYEKITAPDPIV